MPDTNPGLMTIFNEAMDQSDPVARAAYLDRVCCDNADLRRRVEELLAAHAGAGRFLEGDAPNAATLTFAEATGAFIPNATGAHEAASAPRAKERSPAIDSIGNIIAGRYTLLSAIGEGGMGSVYLAEQTEPVKRQVALKLIKTGMDSKAVLARFDAERQALALMDHPNIARIYDGGVTDRGQPFFVMELVKGMPLTDYCDRKRLTVDARLQLFVSVCQAVQHAHLKGIIHRDLKPGNVLVIEVDGRPTPKVIDFGVAKATELKLTDLSFADVGTIVGTPAYMSPEQADPTSMDIDTRTDVYALGVMLYELLTGAPPIDASQFKKGAILEMLRMVREVEPPRPSTKLSTADALPNIAANRNIEPAKLAKLLQGELDWVVLKALEKDRTRRYETANGLAQDIQRYLADEVVEARPPSRGYRLKKFVRRHKGQVLAASLVLLVLIGGVVGTSIGMVRAETQRKRAQDLAKKNADLAEDESRAKDEARKLAVSNGKLADAEQNARMESDRQLLRTMSILFTSQLDRAKEIRDTNPTQAIEMLFDHEKCPAKLRDIGWNFGVHAIRHGLVSSVRIPRTARAFAWSPNGKLLATAIHSNPLYQIALIEVETGKVRATFPESVPARGILLAFSPDGSRLAVAADGSSSPLPKDAGPLASGTIQIWDVAEVKKLSTLKGHKDDVIVMTFSPDRELLATGSLDNTVHVWDLKTNKAKHVIQEHGREVGAVAFSPDGKQIATGGGDNTIKLWDVDGFKLCSTWTPAPNPAVQADQKKAQPEPGESKQIHGIRAVQFSPDGHVLASSSTNQPLEFREVRTGVVLATNRDYSPFRSIVFHPNGQSVLAYADRGGTKWFTLTGKLLRVISGALVEGSDFRREQSLIATRYGERVDVWDLDTPLESATITLKKAKLDPPAVFGSSGDVLAVGGNEWVDLWDVHTGRIRKTLTGHTNPVTTLALSPDGRTLASCTSQEGGEVRLWDFSTGEFLGAIELEGMPKSLAFSRDGSTLATVQWRRAEKGSGRAGGPVVLLWDVKARKLLAPLNFPEGNDIGISRDQATVAFSPTEPALVVAWGSSLTIWNTKTREVQWQILTRKEQLDRAYIGSKFLSMAISPDGKAIATLNYTVGQPAEIILWDPASGKRTTTSAIRPPNVPAGTIRFLIPFNPHSIVFSPDGNNLITCVYDTIQVWDVLALQERASIWVTGSPYQQQSVDSLHATPEFSRAVLSADGRVLASLPRITSASSDKPAQIQLWDLSRPAILLSFRSRAGRGMLFSRDSKTLIESTDQGVMRFWDLKTCAVRAEVDTTRQAVGTVSSPDGRYLAGTDLAGPDQNNLRVRVPPNANAGTFTGFITLWEVQTKKMRKIEIGKGVPRYPTYLPDGQSLVFVRDASLDTEHKLAVEILDLTQGRTTAAIPIPDGGISQPVLSPDGNLLAATTSDGLVRLIDLRKKVVLAPLKARGITLSTKIGFVKDSTRLVIRQGVGPVAKQTMWDWRAGTQVDEPIPDVFMEQSTSPDGRYELVPRSIFEVDVIDRKAKPAITRRR